VKLKDRIILIRRWQEIRKLQYPENPNDGDWILVVNQAKAWDEESLLNEWKVLGKEGEPERAWYFNIDDENHLTGTKHFQTHHYDHVYVVIKRINHSEGVTIGSVDVTRLDFPKRWRELVSAAKVRVDMLNSMDKALGMSELQCANCENQATEDDYLCAQCRVNHSA
jgi:hypothetical protein